VQRIDNRRGTRVKDAALLGGKYRSHLALDLGQGDAELIDVARQQPGQQGAQKQARDARLGRDRIAQPAEEALLGVTREALDAEWQRQYAPPPFRHRVSRDQRADRAFIGDARLNDEPGRSKRPDADARARRAAARRGQLLRPGSDACQFR
jgi:hypothetical protein